MDYWEFLIWSEDIYMSSSQIDTEKLPEVKETEELVKESGSEEKIEDTRPTDVVDTEVEALNNNKVDVDIEPDVKSNDVKLSLCSLSCVFNCFSWNRPETKK
jgi:hypothetical protein